MSSSLATCLHLNIIKTNKIVSFCLECGVIIITEGTTNSFGIKPTILDIKIEIDPLLHYKSMKNGIKTQNLFSSYSKGVHINEYYRKHLIELIQIITNSNKASNETMYLSILYMDVIFKSINKELKEVYMELIAVGCFLLASK